MGSKPIQPSKLTRGECCLFIDSGSAVFSSNVSISGSGSRLENNGGLNFRGGISGATQGEIREGATMVDKGAGWAACGMP